MRYVKQFVTEKTPRATLLRWIVISVTIAATILSLTLPAFAQTKYVITDGDNVIVYMSSSNDPAVVIKEAGLHLGAEDTYTTQTVDGVSNIHINRIQMITVNIGGKTTVLGTYGGTVSSVLAASKIDFEPEMLLSCQPDDLTYDGMVVHLTTTTTDTVSYEDPIAYETEVYEEPSLEPGDEVVVCEGSNGLLRSTAEIVYQDGVEVSRSIISEEVIVSPVNRVVLRGVDRSVSDSDGSGDVEFGDPVIVAPTDGPQYVPGTNLEYSEIWDFQATAYYCEPHAWNTTYTGTEARVGAIAVDPNFIPLGTRMYIVSADGKYIYGYCVAEDIGGAIKGRIVDLYFNTYQECIDFGRRDVKIYVLK